MMHQVDNIYYISRQSQFPDSGTNFILIGTEEISYTGISGNELTGVTRGVRGTQQVSTWCWRYSN